MKQLCSGKFTNTKEALCKWSTLLGVFFLHFPFGLAFFWGNMYVYCASYILHHLHSMAGVQAPWIVSIKLCATSVTAASAGSFTKFCGKRIVIYVGVLLTCGSYFVAFVVIRESVLWFDVVFGLLYGLGDGLVIVTVVEYVLDWCGEKSGLYISLCRSGMFIGAVLANQFVSLYVNPFNLEPDRTVEPTRFFSQKVILDHVLDVFIYLGGWFLTVQTVGFLMLRSKESLLEKDPDATSDYGSLEKETKRHEINEKLEIKEIDGSKTKSQTPPAAQTIIEEPSLTPLQMLKTPQFYALFVAFITSNVSFVLVNMYYKSFGQIWIHDDYFLTNIGTIAPVLTAFTSVAWGIFMDRFGVKTTMVVFTGLLTVLCGYYYLTPRTDEWLFGVITLFFSATASSKFSLYNVATVKIFGKKHQSTNFGVMYLGSIGTLLTPPIIQAVLLNFGWFYVFSMAAVFNLITMILFIVVLKS